SGDDGLMPTAAQVVGDDGADEVGRGRLGVGGTHDRVLESRCIDNRVIEGNGTRMNRFGLALRRGWGLIGGKSEVGPCRRSASVLLEGVEQAADAVAGSLPALCGEAGVKELADALGRAAAVRPWASRCHVATADDGL